MPVCSRVSLCSPRSDTILMNAPSGSSGRYSKARSLHIVGVLFLSSFPSFVLLTSNEQHNNERNEGSRNTRLSQTRNKSHQATHPPFNYWRFLSINKPRIDSIWPHNQAPSANIIPTTTANKRKPNPPKLNNVTIALISYSLFLPPLLCPAKNYFFVISTPT